MERKYTVSCYTLMQPSIPRMKFIQNDTDTSIIEFNLYDDANDPMLDITDASITIERSDGYTVTYGVGTGITMASNIITFILPPSALLVAGQVSASLHVYNGLNRLTMANFRYYVTAEVSNSNPITEDENYPILTGLIDRISNSAGQEESRINNENSRIANENSRITLYNDLENKRVTDYWKGAKGDKGDRGDQGIQGIQGPKGDKGDKGDQGIQGFKGDKPNHQWVGTNLSFENPDGTWGTAVELNTGDMYKSTYDTDDDGIVDKAKALLDESNLLTADKTTIGAINELFTSASNGKAQIATAITGKGVQADSSNTFSELALKITEISSGESGTSNIKSIQRGVSSILNGTASTTITINSVDVTKTIIIAETSGGTSLAPGKVLVKPNLVNSTTVTFDIGVTTTFDNFYVTWQIVEFNNVKSLQKGTIATTGLSSEVIVNVSNVDQTKSILFHNHSSTNAASMGYMDTAIIIARIVNNTSISFRGNASSSVAWQLIEFI